MKVYVYKVDYRPTWSLTSHETILALVTSVTEALLDIFALETTFCYYTSITICLNEIYKNEFNSK